MKNSEIFENYAKIALEQGLISEAEEETNPRYDSQDMSTIEALYGVQPNGKDDDILDKAHPEPVVVAPAYDRVNGLVENLKERHDIMCGIARKPNDGKLTQHRYVAANEDLLNQLTRIGFVLDNAEQSDLMKLADSCSEKLVKEALEPLTIAALVAAGLAALYTAISQNVAFSQGVAQDSEKVLVELSEAIEDYPDLGPQLSPLMEQITLIKDAAQKVAQIQFVISKSGPPTADKSTTALNALKFMNKGYDDASVQLLEHYKEACIQLGRVLPDYINLLKMKAKQLEETHSDFADLARRVMRWVVPSDLEDAWKHLETLLKSVSEAPAFVDSQISLFNKMRAQGDQVEKLKAKLQGQKTAPADHWVTEPSAKVEPNQEEKPKEDPLQAFFKRK